MGIRSLLRKVFGRDRANDAEESSAPATSVPAQASAPEDPSSAAERAAADLVAASFDNPQVPPARRASDTEVAAAGAAEAEPAGAEAVASAPEAEPARTEAEPATASADADADEPAVTAEATDADAPESPAADEPTDEPKAAAEEPVVAEAAAEEPVVAEKPVVAEAGEAETDEPAAEATVEADAPETAAEPSADAEVAEEASESPAAAAEDTTDADAPSATTEPSEPSAATERTVDAEEPVAAEAAEETPATAEEPSARIPAARESAEQAEEPAAAAEAPVPAPAEEPVAADSTPVEAPVAVADTAPADEPTAEVTAEEPVAAVTQPTAEVTAEVTAAEPATDAPAEAPAGPALSLAKVKAAAPHLADAYKAAGAVLKKQGLAGARAAVYLVVDRSGSMRPYFKDGSVQRLAEQTVALAAHLSEDATVTAVFFSTDIDGTAELRPADLTPDRIETVNASLGRLGRTNYHRAIEEVLAHHEKNDPARPALVVFQTDGAPESRTAATQALAEAADRPVHWRFTAWGEEDGKAFDWLRRLDAPKTGVHLAGPAPLETPHAAFYRGLLADAPAL